MHPGGQCRSICSFRTLTLVLISVSGALPPSQASCDLAVSNRRSSAMAPPLTGSLPRFRNTNDTTRSPRAPYGHFQMSNRSIGRPQRPLHMLKYSDADNFQPPSGALTYGRHASVAAAFAGPASQESGRLDCQPQSTEACWFQHYDPSPVNLIMLYPLNIP
jgi:hypothetical protein